MDMLQAYDSSSDEDAADKSAITRTTRQEIEESEDVNEKDHCSDLKRERVVDVVDFATSASNFFERSVPHVRGNWAGHVFLRLDDCSTTQRRLYRLARRSIAEFRDKLEKAGWQGTVVSHVPWIPSEDDNATNNNDDSSSDDEEDCKRIEAEESHSGLHVSLSRAFYLQLASIQSFVADLRQRLVCEHGLTVALGGAPRVLVNDEGTRSFWCKPLSCATPSLVRLIQHVDQVMVKYKQATYYDPPLMHVSLASVPGNVESLLSSETNEDHDPILIPVRQVHCTFGTTKRFSIDLEAER